MKKMVLLGLSLMMLSSACVFARTHYDPFGTNTKNKMNFCNQVIQEVLTPEEFSEKTRTEELIQGSGDSVFIIDLLSGSKNSFDEEFVLYVHELFHEENHDVVMKLSNLAAKKVLVAEFRRRGVKQVEEMDYEVISENPGDIIYIAEQKVSDPNSDLGLVCITRDVRVKKWVCIIQYKSIASKMNPEKKAEWIERLKKNTTINNWIVKSR